MDNVISSEDLYGSYINGSDPQENYGDMIVLEGITTYVGPDMFGLPSIEFGPTQNHDTNTLAVLNDPEYKDVQVGKDVVVTGELRGFTSGIVLLKNCEITSVGDGPY
ncbi:hypothetical protein [Furfurilactobacillus siliginis]|uniref:Uncharacterized protein n=1 Tax=Furfurilactobacillus siliginis TaxID=348151 RepID=A0A0R2LDH4_9LACO|nr:hypothetical protein [Furfurilactobacillus siliginis]KRN97292.1 hypothetical protein IV55_GL000220 [Furfurilactobacillus siliginis]GEK28603.1 hypothetical protein LSI01_09140 [Furfurilactobacillus siliginis]